jgi:hypothetical protein
MRALHDQGPDGITDGITDGGPHGLAICEPHDVAVGKSLDDTDIRPVGLPNYIANAGTLWVTVYYPVFGPLDEPHP